MLWQELRLTSLVKSSSFNNPFNRQTQVLTELNTTQTQNDAVGDEADASPAEQQRPRRRRPRGATVAPLVRSGSFNTSFQAQTIALCTFDAMEEEAAEQEQEDETEQQEEQPLPAPPALAVKPARRHSCGAVGDFKGPADAPCGDCGQLSLWCQCATP